MSNISAIPRYNLQSVSDSLRQLANRIDSGEVDAVRCVVSMEDSDGNTDYCAFGSDFTRAHAAGILVSVQQDIFK